MAYLPPNGTRSLWKGAVAGAVAGVAAGWAMTAFHVALAGLGQTGAREPQNDKPVDGRDDATMKAADALAQATRGESLTRREKQAAAPAVHYSFALVAGTIWGLLREVAPSSRLTRGGPFGVAVWLGADNTMLPLTGLSRPPLTYPLETQLRHFAAHLVYGFATERVFRAVRGAL